MNYEQKQAERRRATENIDFLRFVWAQAKYPISPGGHREAWRIESELKNFRSVRLDGFLQNQKAAVAGGTAQEANWAYGFADLTSIAQEWVLFTQAKTFLDQLPYRRVPFATKTIKTEAPTAQFVGPGVGIAPVALDVSDTSYLLRTKVITIAVVANELTVVWAPGTRENLHGVLTRSVIRGMDAAALDPDSAAVTDERPASLLNGVSPIGKLGTTVSTVLGQVQDMLERLVDGGSDLDSAVFALHPYEAIRLSSLVTTEGVPAFPQLTAVGGSILGIPAVVSVGCVRSGSPSERVFAVVDGAQILVADDNAIEVSASNIASLHMDSATTQDAPDGTGSSVVSLFQTDSTAIKVGRTINWERAQDAAVAWCTV